MQKKNRGCDPIPYRSVWLQRHRRSGSEVIQQSAMSARTRICQLSVQFRALIEEASGNIDQSILDQS